MRLLRALVSLLAAAVVIGAFGVVVVRAASVPAPTALGRASPEQRARIAERLAGAERGWESRAEQMFPGDLLSQHDAFHNFEHMSVRREASFAGVSVGEVLLAVDEELRRDPGSRRTSPAPCKPRPFYQ